MPDDGGPSEATNANGYEIDEASVTRRVVRLFVMMVPMALVVLAMTLGLIACLLFVFSYLARWVINDVFNGWF